MKLADVLVEPLHDLSVTLHMQLSTELPDLCLLTCYGGAVHGPMLQHNPLINKFLDTGFGLKVQLWALRVYLGEDKDSVFVLYGF